MSKPKKRIKSSATEFASQFDEIAKKHNSRKLKNPIALTEYTKFPLTEVIEISGLKKDCEVDHTKMQLLRDSLNIAATIVNQLCQRKLALHHFAKLMSIDLSTAIYMISGRYNFDFKEIASIEVLFNIRILHID